MTTAFQPNAFQNNAFQVDAQQAFGATWYGRETKKKARKLIETYEHIVKELPDNVALISAVKPFVIKDAIDLDRIHWQAMAEHELAVKRFERITQQLLAVIEERNKEEEDTIFLLLM